jgi:hypothetical protein
MTVNAVDNAITNATFHNCSNISLPVSHNRLLSFGLNFVPTPPPPKSGVIHDSCTKLTNNLRRKHFFRNSNDPPRSSVERKCYVKSSFVPPPATAPIENFCQHLSVMLPAVYTAAAASHETANHSKADMIDLEKTSSRPDLDIKRADKNLGLSVTLTSTMHDAAVKILTAANPKTYRRLPRAEAIELSKEFGDRVTSLLRRCGDSIFSEKVVSFITQKFAETTRFPAWYLMPKLHKIMLAWRPICPSMHYVTHEASVWLSEIMNPVAKSLSTVCNSSLEFIKDLDDTTVPDDCTMVTADVTALYPSIPTPRGLQVVEAVLLDPTVSPLSDSRTLVSAVIALLRLVLTFNVFEYGNEFWLQLVGTAMGTPAACAYANIFMFGIEISLISEWLDLKRLKYFTRYIDDMFAILRAAHAKAFVDALNELCPGIAFTFEISNDTAIMLDVNVYRGDRWNDTAGHRYDYRVHQKPSNLYQYITNTSEHPATSKHGTVGMELLRYAIRSSTPADYVDVAKLFYGRIRARGYSQAKLRKLFCTRSYSDRIPALAAVGQPKPPQQRRDMILIPYAAKLVKYGLSRRINEIWRLTDNVGPPPLVVFSKGRNVFDIMRTHQKRRTPQDV